MSPDRLAGPEATCDHGAGGNDSWQPMSGSTRRAVVTGAASGIGAAVAERLLDEGVSVLAVDVDETRLASFADARGCDALVADLADLDQRAHVVERAGEIDYLVNAAGIIQLKPIFEVTVEDWRRIHTVNAEAVFFLCGALGPNMRRGGAIVNVSSSSAKMSSTTEAAAYAASKAAVVSISRSYAYALAPHVRVNAICPGITDTPMQERVLEDVARIRQMTVADLRAARNATVPLGRSASPAECAGVIHFLLSSEAGYLTGQAINFTGGMITW